MKTIICEDGRVITYKVIRKAIKNTYFRVGADGIVVSAPKLLPESVIRAYLTDRFTMFHDRLSATDKPEPDNVLSLWGQNHPFVLKKGRFRWDLNDEGIVAYAVTDDITQVKRRVLKDALHRRMDMMRPAILGRLSALGLKERPYRVVWLKSKYGSYHRTKDVITLNSFLARLEPEYLFYVVMHEYAHVKVFNHSKAFYAVLDALLPGHREIRKRLKRCAIVG
jgi:predicted metal-dependent hydrolase